MNHPVAAYLVLMLATLTILLVVVALAVHQLADTLARAAGA